MLQPDEHGEVLKVIYTDETGAGFSREGLDNLKEAIRHDMELHYNMYTPEDWTTFEDCSDEFIVNTAYDLGHITLP